MATLQPKPAPQVGREADVCTCPAAATQRLPEMPKSQKIDKPLSKPNPAPKKVGFLFCTIRQTFLGCVLQCDARRILYRCRTNDEHPTQGNDR